jgi:glycosyltransferase involved in cell wall biosynthesis
LADPAQSRDTALPIHFFTIVLNGEPFIRYHIDVFRTLDCDWHWHVVEGVASLVHDTAWSTVTGGHITTEIHRRGLSSDGTSEYLDTLVQQYPGRVTLYRKPLDALWDGKQEMVSAPLKRLPDDCLLWQVDSDELWTVAAIRRVHRLFVDNPDRTAAFYWCDYFVGERLVIATRYGYAQNPDQEWLRTWRFRSGAHWVKHEPPTLMLRDATGCDRDLGRAKPFLHDEMEAHGVTFQHFAYVTEAQARFKETYYGYTAALESWRALQRFDGVSARLGDYLGWVRDNTMIEPAEARGVVPLAYRDPHGVWTFRRLDDSNLAAKISPPATKLRIVVDAVFFQLLNSGIGRVWRSLFSEWAESGFGRNVTVLDRAGTAPRIPGLRYRSVPAFTYAATGADAEMLQRICDEEAADLFTSTYYTCPITTPSAFLAHDMIPEMLGAPLDDQAWREKHYAIEHAAIHLAVSHSTARDLAKLFPAIRVESVRIARNGVEAVFAPKSAEAVAAFRAACGIAKPYFLLVGERCGYAGYKNCELFFRAFAALPEKAAFEIVCAGGQPALESEFRALIGNASVHLLRPTDAELSVAYSGAVALVYPSRYEGFGMPIAEALACGCPVITCRNSSLIEVAGEAALYVGENDVAGLTRALQQVQEPTRRADLSTRGRAQAVQFTWSAMAETIAEEFIAGIDRLHRGDLPRPAPLWRTMRAMQRQLQLELTPAVESRLAADPVRKRLTAIDAIGHEAGRDVPLRVQLMAARDLLAGIQNSPFWRLRRLVLQTLRPFGVRRKL